MPTTPAPTSPLRLTRRGRWALSAGAALALGAGVWGGATYLRSDVPPVASPSPSPSPSADPVPTWAPAVAVVPADLTRIEAASVEQLEAALVATLYAEAPVVVIAGDADGDTPVARWVAARLRAPLVPNGRDVRDLEAVTVVVVGAADAPPGVATVRVAPVSGAAPFALAIETATAGVTDGDAGDAPPPAMDLRPLQPLMAAAAAGPPPTAGVVLVRADDPMGREAAAVARGAGFAVVVTHAADPRADPAVGRLLHEVEGPVVLVGGAGAWDDVGDDLVWQVAVARRGLELPGGGQVLFPYRRLVALYGATEGGALGALGEQRAAAAAGRVADLAADYAGLTDVPVVPTFEIIATVASGGPAETGDYSRRTDRAALAEWIDVAEDEGIYVVLDLQPGRTDFLIQAKEYEEFLRRPHVGLALDPEWRLGPNQVHLRQIGSVHADEVNAVVTWLADLVREDSLPQKLLIVHQFKASMIQERGSIDTSRTEIAVLIQMDGQGSQGSKVGTYAALTGADAPDVWWGWKNFYDEDTPSVLGPADTYARRPVPVFVSYQ